MKLADVVAKITPDDDRRMEKRMAVATKIYNSLKSQGMAQKTLANKMGKTESEISEWISGERNMTIDTLSDFENALGISLLNIHSERTQRIPSQTVINVHVGNSSTCHITNRLGYNNPIIMKKNHHGNKLLS